MLACQTSARPRHRDWASRLANGDPMQDLDGEAPILEHRTRLGAGLRG